MFIDNSQYTLFLSNPEKYRLQYLLNHPAAGEKISGGLSPQKTPTPLLDGSVFHLIREGENKGWSSEEIDRRLAELATPIAQKAGRALAAAFRQKYAGDKRFVLQQTASGEAFAEVEFSIQIPGSPHFLIGKMDEMVEFDGALWVGDYKSANAKATENRKKIEFNSSSQPIFYISALRMMGYEVKGMLYRVVTKHIPPQHYIIPVTRGPLQLEIGLRSIHQVAEQIEFMKRTFGVDDPWPHNGGTYPCNYLDMAGNPTCEFAHVCQRPSHELTPEDLELFKPRESHLDIDK